MSMITCRSNLLRGTSARISSGSYYTYVGGATGAWEITELTARSGDPLPTATHVDMIQGPLEHTPVGTSWILRGPVRNTRYISREESPPSGIDPFPALPTCAALIPIRRSKQWWRLDSGLQDEVIGPPNHAVVKLRSLSSMLRRWKARCDQSDQFDCVTWFEYEPRDATAFDDLLAEWRASDEWKFVDRECDIRLVRAV